MSGTYPQFQTAWYITLSLKRKSNCRRTLFLAPGSHGCRPWVYDVLKDGNRQYLITKRE